MRTVLIIEDDYTLLEGLQIFLEMEGFRTLTASNGHNGLDLAREHRPDLILTNFQMHGGDGIDVLRGLRGDESTAEIPVIFITANHQLSVRDRALQEGADVFLRKPFSTKDLMDCVNSLLYRELQDH